MLITYGSPCVVVVDVLGWTSSSMVSSSSGYPIVFIFRLVLLKKVRTPFICLAIGDIVPLPFFSMDGFSINQDILGMAFFL